MACINAKVIKSAGVASIIALAAACVHAQRSSPRPASIFVAPFTVLGEATAALAESLRGDLAAALDLDPCIAARADRDNADSPAGYILRGEAYVEIGGRKRVGHLWLCSSSM